ncbi:MAG TPA: patatin-like phospholipase family protein [Lysobacter sp.]
MEAILVNIALPLASVVILLGVGLVLDRRRLRVVCCAVVCLGLVSACAVLPREPVPVDLTVPAQIPGMPGVRAVTGGTDAAMKRDFMQSLQDESPEDFPVDANGQTHYAALALSGGGAYGAFGAGFLKGWSESGTRPVFKIVTGVSTGALTAPFAFLGPRYDDMLHRFYTTTTTDDVLTRRSPLDALLRRDSLADATPLSVLLERYITADLLAQIAHAHRNGRRLYMGTVDLDSRRFVVWNMGLIATHGDEAALALFRKVMMASSAVPIVFSPVMIEVEANGRRYDEMHVDGFVGANVFMNVGLFDTAKMYREAGRNAREDIFIIHNGQHLAPGRPTERSLRGIAERVVEASGRSTIVGDLFREYAFAQRNGATFRWVTIDPSVELADALSFDPVAMGRLYAVGYRVARGGQGWITQPPGF